MKYNVNGREKETYEMNNLELLKAFNSAEYKGNEELLNTLVYRFAYNLTPHDDNETNDDVFVRFFSNFVNGEMLSSKNVAKLMANEHRYLQEQMFIVCYEYIRILAKNFEIGFFDPRTEWACKRAHKMLSVVD